MILIAVLFMITGGLCSGVSGLFGRFTGSYNSSQNTGGNTGTGLANQPVQVQTQTALDLTELHGALDSRIPEWERQIATNQEQHVSAGDAGMANDNNIKDVVYGKCGSAFFVYVVDKGAPTNAGGANGQGYAYTTAPSPSTCHPSQYQVTDWENDGGGWWFVYLQS